MHNPKNGHIYRCLKGSKEQHTVKGVDYVYDLGHLKQFTRRSVSVLINGDELLATMPERFELVKQCPFCRVQTRSPFGDDTWMHDGAECAKDWDARVKGYER